MVTIEFSGAQLEATGTGSLKMPLTGNTRVRDVLDFVKNRYPQLFLDEETVLVTVNHEIAPLHRELKPDDRVSFIPHIGGG